MLGDVATTCGETLKTLRGHNEDTTRTQRGHNEDTKTRQEAEILDWILVPW